MFDLFRSRDKAVRIVLGAMLLVVAASMLLYLVPGGTPTAGNNGDQVVAEVAGQPISVQEVESQLQSMTRNQRIPSNLLYVYAPQIVEQMVHQRAMAYEARRLGLSVSDTDLANVIQSAGNGQFTDRAVYQQFVADQGMNIPQFEAKLRQDMLAARLENVASSGIVVTPQEAMQEYKDKNEKVKLEYAAFSPTDLRLKINPTPAELEQEFNQKRGFYHIPEKKNVDLIVADEDKIAAGMQVSDQALLAYYNSHLDQFRTPERVHARHILLLTKGKSADEIKAIRAKADDLLKQVKAGGDFEALAKANSQDPGSAQKGGDLGWITRGQTVANFEKTAFSLKPNEISGVVTTEYGFHIIQVLDHQQARLQPFAEVKNDIATAMKKQLSVDQVDNLADQAHSELAKNPAGAQQIADQLHLQYIKADSWAPGDVIPGIGTDKAVADAVAGLTKKGDVSPVVQSGSTRLVVAAVRDIVPGHLAAFADVQEQVRHNYIDSKANAEASENANKFAQLVKSNGGDFEAAAKAVGATVKTSDAFTRTGAAEGIGAAEYVKSAFTSPVGAIIGPVVTGGRLVVAKVIEKIPADPAQFAAHRQEIVQDLRQKRSQEQNALFEDSVVARLTSEGKLKYHKAVLDRLLARYRS